MRHLMRVRPPRAIAACAAAIALVLQLPLQMSAASAQERSLGASAALVGLPVFTADQREIGRITGMVREPQEPMLLAEIERPGAIGPHTVAIPIDLFVQRADRIELKLTFEQITDRLSGPEEER
jgi:hypothetical protein